MLNFIEAGSGFSLVGVELAKVGVHNLKTGKWTVDEQVISELASNFDAQDPLPLNRDHKPEGDALGVIVGAYPSSDGRKLLVDIDDIPEEIKKAHEENRILTRSVEAYKTKEDGWILDGGAWLGQKRPGIKKMQRISKGQFKNHTEAEAVVFCSQDGEFTYYTDKLESKEVQTNMSETERLEKLIEAQGKELEAITASASITEAALAEAVKTVSLQKAALDASLKRMDKVEAARDNERAETAVAWLDTCVAEGRITPAMRLAGLDDLVMASCKSDTVIKAEQKVEGSDEVKEVDIPIMDVLKNVFAAAPVDGAFNSTEQTRHADTTLKVEGADDLVKKIDAYAAKHNVTDDEAATAVLAEASNAGVRLTPRI